MVSNAAAAPVGLRRCCSQFCRVLTLTPIMAANMDCDSPVFSRTALTSGSATVKTRDGWISPLAIATASFMLSCNCSNSSLSMTFQLLDQCPEYRDLFRFKTFFLCLGVYQQHVCFILRILPVVDKPCAATFPLAWQSKA